MAEYSNDFGGHIIAPLGLGPVADELKQRGWTARARANTIRPDEEHLHIEDDSLRLMTQPLTGSTHMISGEVDLKTDRDPSFLEKLATDLDESNIQFSLELYDEAGAKVIQKFG